MQRSAGVLPKPSPHKETQMLLDWSLLTSELKAPTSQRTVHTRVASQMSYDGSEDLCYSFSLNGQHGFS